MAQSSVALNMDEPVSPFLEACAKTCTNVEDGDASKVVKVGLSILNIISEFSSCHFQMLSGHFTGCLAILDLGEAIQSFHQCVNGKVGERLSKGGGETCGALGDITFAAASFGGVFLFVEELGAFGMIAQGIGCEALIGSVGATVAVAVLNGAVLSATAVGYALFAAKAGLELYEAVQNEQQHDLDLKFTKIKQALNIISKIACVALYILMLVPGLNAGALAIFALVTFSLALGTAFYGNYFKREIQREEIALQQKKKQPQR